MAKCKDCPTVFSTYGGSEGTACPICRSRNIDVSAEEPHRSGPELETDPNFENKYRSIEVEEKPIVMATMGDVSFAAFIGGVIGAATMTLLFWGLL